MDDSIMGIIGLRLNSALATREVTQKELAHNLNVTDNTVSYWCNGKRTPNTQQIIEISKYLNVSSDYLLGLTEQQTTDTDIKAICEYTGLSENTISKLYLSPDVDYSKGFQKLHKTQRDKLVPFIDLLFDDYGNYMLFCEIADNIAHCKHQLNEAEKRFSECLQNADDLSADELNKKYTDIKAIFKSSKLSFFEADENFKLIVKSAISDLQEKCNNMEIDINLELTKKYGYKN